MFHEESSRETGIRGLSRASSPANTGSGPGTGASNSCAAPFAPAGWAAGRNSAGGEEMSVTSNGSKSDAFVGVDVGGTHTDVSVVIGSQVERGKALTTYDDFSRGVLEAVEVAAERFDLSVEEL